MGTELVNQLSLDLMGREFPLTWIIFIVYHPANSVFLSMNLMEYNLTIIRLYCDEGHL